MPTRLSTIAKARLATEIVVTYAHARRARDSLPLPRALEVLRGPARAPRSVGRGRRLPLADPALDGARLGAAVVRTLEPLPFDSRCLMRSLVLVRLLARRGATGAVVISARPGADQAQLEAHAWVELDGRPLLAPAPDDHGRLVTL